MKRSKILCGFQTQIKQECIPVGCVPPTCCPYLPACTAPREGVHAHGGFTCLGGPCPGEGGVPAQGGTCLGGYVLPPLRTEVLTHATENITLPRTSFAGGKKQKFSLRSSIFSGGRGEVFQTQINSIQGKIQISGKKSPLAPTLWCVETK